MADEITLSCLFDRSKIPGWGIFGGESGGLSQLRVKRVGEKEFVSFMEAYHTISPSKFTNILLKRGDIVRYVTPGGGGYGDPYLRDPEAVLTDVENGWVYLDAARDLYGVAISEVDGDYVIDESGTETLRSTRQAVSAA